MVATKAVVFFLVFFIAVQGEIVSISIDEFYTLTTTGQVDLVIDVRTDMEWTGGHVENATLVANLATILDETPMEQMDATLEDLGILRCRNCPLIVYCRSGARATRALRLLNTKAGFTGPLYNGMGLNQWSAAGFPLNWGPTIDAPCMKTAEGDTEDSFCSRSSGADNAATEAPAPAPADTTPSEPSTVALPERKEQTTAKCGSLSQESGLGGSAAQAKDCSRLSANEGGGRRRRRQRGLRGL